MGTHATTGGDGTEDADAILVGGPRDQTAVVIGDAGLVELEFDGLIHRYIRTHQRREHDGRSLVVYNYDGEVAVGGSEPGSESSAGRVASPLAAGRAEALPPDQVDAPAAGRS